MGMEVERSLLMDVEDHLAEGFLNLSVVGYKPYCSCGLQMMTNSGCNLTHSCLGVNTMSLMSK